MADEHAGSAPRPIAGTLTDANDVLVSVVIPVLDAEESIDRCLEAVLRNGHPPDRLEILVVDGGSTDGTRAKIAVFMAENSAVRLLDNPARTLEKALNFGIRSARGDVILRVDAHAQLDPGYISGCVRALVETGADCVGGRVKVAPRRSTLIGGALANSMSARFGVGNTHKSRGRRADEIPNWVHSVFAACYRRSVFDEVGDFRLPRSEDLELHHRMAKAGLRTLFVPTLSSTYRARSDLWPFWRHAVDNGRWAVLPFFYTGEVIVSWRHLVPAGFVGTLLVLGLLGLSHLAFLAALSVLLAVYLGAATAVAVAISRREREPRFALVIPFAFVLLHVGYGIGSWLGLGRGLAMVVRRTFGRTRTEGG